MEGISSEYHGLMKYKNINRFEFTLTLKNSSLTIPFDCVLGVYRYEGLSGVTVNGEAIDVDQFYSAQPRSVVTTGGVGDNAMFREYVFCAEDVLSAPGAANLSKCYMYPINGGFVSDKCSRITTTDIYNGNWKSTILANYFDDLQISYMGDRGSLFLNCTGITLKYTTKSGKKLDPTFIFLEQANARCMSPGIGKYVNITLGGFDQKSYLYKAGANIYRYLFKTNGIVTRLDTTTPITSSIMLARVTPSSLIDRAYFMKEQTVVFSIMSGIEPE